MTLYFRHQAAAKYFTEALNEPLADKPHELITSVSQRHQEFMHVIRQLIEDLPDLPVKPNRDMQSSQELQKNIDWSNDIEVYQHVQLHTREMHKLYRQILDNNGIPKGISQQLEQYARKLSKSLNKLDRIVSTGAERDMRI